MVKSDLTLKRARKIGIIGMCLVLFAIVFQSLIFPSFFKSHVKNKIALKKGWPMRKIWSKSSHSHVLNVYLFNVTNPTDISKGKKPILKEIGPFVYDVWQEKINQFDNEKDDTLTYSLKNTYYFNEKKSQFSDETEFTLAHLMAIAIPNTILKTNPSRMTIASKAVDSVWYNPESLFIKVKVKTYLFGGIRVVCKGRDDFYSLVLCNDYDQSWFKYRMEKGDGYFSSSMFGTLNATDVYNGKTRIIRGVNNVMEIGNIIEYNKMKNMSIWKNDECDALRGTDGTIFHPFLDINKDKVLAVTKTFYCRHLTYRYDSDVEFLGLKLARYTMTFGSDMESNVKDKCFCIAADKCLKNGVYELYKCFTLARIGSNPHFYLADPYYVRSVDGLKPTKEKHLSVIDIDPLTGLIVRNYFRIQFSAELRPIKKYRLMQQFPNSLLPLAWIDEVTISPDTLIKNIKNIYKLRSIAKIFSYLMIFCGLTMFGYAAFYEYRSYREKINVIKSVQLKIKEETVKES